MLHPVKFIFTAEINRAIFFEVPIAEIENTFDRFGRNPPGGIIETGAEKYQISNYYQAERLDTGYFFF